MRQRLVDALVGVAQLDVLADDGDLHRAVHRLDQVAQHGVPVGQVEVVDVKPQLLEHVDIHALRGQRLRHLVDRMPHILLLDYQFRFDIAEHGQLAAVFGAHGALAPADEDVGNDADRTQDADRLLRGLGLELVGRLQEGHQRDVHEEPVVPPDLLPQLADRLQKGLALDVAHRAADLGEHQVHVGRVERADGGLDLVGDVRNDLHGLPEVAALPLALDHAAVDAAGRVVAGAGAGLAGEALVVPEIQVGLGAVGGDVHLAVLIGRHGAWIHIQIGIELLQADAVAALLQQQGQRGGGQSLAEGGDHPARDKDVLGHDSPLRGGHPPAARSQTCPDSSAWRPTGSSTGTG